MKQIYNRNCCPVFFLPDAWWFPSFYFFLLVYIMHDLFIFLSILRFSSYLWLNWNVNKFIPSFFFLSWSSLQTGIWSMDWIWWVFGIVVSQNGKLTIIAKVLSYHHTFVGVPFYVFLTKVGSMYFGKAWFYAFEIPFG